MRPRQDTDISTNSFNDKRLEKRFAIILDALQSRPQASIPQACQSPAEIEAAYRFLESERVHVAAIDCSIYQETLKRAMGNKVILAAQDTSTYNYSTQKNIKGLGPIDQKKTQGALMHSAFAISTAGLPLGLLDRRLWTRDGKEFGKKKMRRLKKTEEKESQRWIDCEAAIAERVPQGMRVVVISDREGDFYDHFAASRQPGIDLLVRISHNRKTDDSDVDTLFSRLEESEPRGEYQVTTIDPRNGKERTAIVTYRYTEVALRAPQGDRIMHTQPITLWAIMAREEHPPEGVRGLEWKLLTTLEIKSDEDALQCIRWYSYRWTIERFHYVLKSGCQVEKLQLETAERIEKAIALYSAVAARILYMTYLGRKEPDTSVEAILTQPEWEALYCTIHKTRIPPAKPPTVKNAIIMIAKLGGFLARKGDGDPGVKRIWYGLRRLSDITEAYLLFASPMKEKRCG